ncbi:MULTISPECIES: SDR family oxidoreductase [Halobacterium]|uniref:Oxidoreductase n=3 Tax=Halobacterium salinarum TaxID=2242 RepID=Q9HSR4_HALSA|nr:MULTISPECIES: SDR family oxidoreductase [Halobacterium]AAG18739.1 oxidoreductase [Halobacterium salinarum NRC-1]MBB6091038.1 NADP-dependent 3-hydroxy acid dehydrogenase YdfG [Halobacterium salinarum]MCF2164700.1 SDR family oxidoreductase [Halobacterium salinarum]MCF2166854.1 SDR family oxidoreductase [Halobacterium salinarum]MCF2206374.1 SDR family oxidoreductase [Halobacterium salinarum]
MEADSDPTDAQSAHDHELAGDVAIVTGASSGIGEATAEALAAEGAHVVLAARRADELAALADRIEDTDGDALVVPTDITDDDAIDDLVSETVDEYGRIDILVNNAGVMLLEPLERADRSNLRQMVEVNLLGLMNLTHAVVPIMQDQDAGHVVNVSSVAGRQADADSSGYNATKFGVNAFTDAIRQELTSQDIRTTIIEPGAVDTELSTHVPDEQVLERFAEMDLPMLHPDDIARGIVYATSQPQRVDVNELLIRPTGQEL